MSILETITARNMKTKQETKVLNPEVVTNPNGTKALKGIAADDQTTKVFKFINKDLAAEIEAALKA